MSTTAGIPTGWDLTAELAELQARHQYDRVPDDIEAWWAANNTVPLGYSSLMEAVASTLAHQQAVLWSVTEPSVDETQRGLKIPAAAPRALAELVRPSLACTEEFVECR
jgi:hypothetical protein